VDLSVVDDFDRSTPPVGKSTLTSFVDFLHEVLDVDHGRLVTEVPVGFKTTVYFEDWCGVEFHSPLGNSLPAVTPDSRPQATSPDPESEFHEYYYRYEERDFSELYGAVAERPGTTPHKLRRKSATVKKVLGDAAYHFNTRAFNEFLRTLCEERGITLVGDRIWEVETADSRIERVAGERGSTPQTCTWTRPDSAGYSCRNSTTRSSSSTFRSIRRSRRRSTCRSRRSSRRPW